MQFQELVRT